MGLLSFVRVQESNFVPRGCQVILFCLNFHLLQSALLTQQYNVVDVGLNLFHFKVTILDYDLLTPLFAGQC